VQGFGLVCECDTKDIRCLQILASIAVSPSTLHYGCGCPHNFVCVAGGSLRKQRGRPRSSSLKAVDNFSSDGPSPNVAEPGTSNAPAAEATVPLNSGLLIHALAGLQAGVVGVIWMLVCFVVAAFWNDGGIWSIPNLFSTFFYGENAWEGGFLRTTWAGLALIVVLYGFLGVVWGCLWSARRKLLLSVYGSLTGLAVYYFFFSYVWVHADPLIPLYAPVRELQVAHILWGAALARSPRYAARIAQAIRPAHVTRAAGTPPPGQDAADIVSGELIR
jgi:hypothetical protein